MKSISVLIPHLAATIVVAIIFIVIYACVQQTYRAGANDPQLQLARDLAQRLNNGKNMDALLPYDTSDISQSLALFVTTYDKNGDAIFSTGRLHEALPILPKGVLDYARMNGENSVTWQPEKDVRMAMVVEKVTAPNVATIAVGRSLREVENRIQKLTTMLLIGFVAAAGIIVLHFLYQAYVKKSHR